MYHETKLEAKKPPSGRLKGAQPEVIRAICCAGRHIATQSELIRAMFFEDSLCCGFLTEELLPAGRLTAAVGIIHRDCSCKP